MERTSGIYKVLSNPLIYWTWQGLSGGSRARRYFIDDYVKIRANESIVDVGCGPGNLLAYMRRDISYVGFDVSESYINEAQKKYQGRGRFVQGDCNVALRTLSPQWADVVICCGVLHHIDEIAIQTVLANSYLLLKPGGRFLCMEPVWVPQHPCLARLHMKCDRGKNIKTEAEWLQIARSAFPTVTGVVRSDLFILPYYVLIVTCKKEA
jgi:ubiquinone/menaquinone biosynthesis C-methylase UbiE